jgi:hypothetical protein
MAAGFLTRAYASAASLVARWVEWADGTFAPVHGNIQLDPTTGLPLDVDAASLVQQADNLPVAGSVSSAAVLFTQDMDGYDSIGIQILSAGTGCTITYEASEDNATWYSVNGLDPNSSSAQMTATSTALGLRNFPRAGRYFRARVSTYGSGTVTVVGHARKATYTPYINTITKQTVSNGASLCATNARVQSAATTNATSVKTSSGVLNQAILTNNAATIAYIKFYNKASAPVVGTDVPIATFSIPANGVPLVITPPVGIAFSTGIAYAITGAAADADATAVAVNQVTGILGYS